MRLNKWLVQAGATFARRKADELISMGRVTVNGHPAKLGQMVQEGDEVRVDGEPLALWTSTLKLIILYKPVGYICSHTHQSSTPIVFDLLPKEFRNYTIIGRLDKDSQGLVLLTNDGRLAQKLTHPSREVPRTYDVKLNKPVTSDLVHKLATVGVELDDGVSVFDSVIQLDTEQVRITMHTGKNRQIRRTFAACGLQVRELKRIQHDTWKLGKLKPKEWVVRDLS